MLKPWQLGFRASLLGVPALSSTETVQMQVWPGCCGRLWIVFHTSCPRREEDCSLWPQVWPPGPRQLFQPTALLLGTIPSVGKGYCGDRCRPQVHPPVVTGDLEALMMGQDLSWSKDS